MLVLLPEDEVRVDQQRIKAPSKNIHIAYHEAPGKASTMNTCVENNLLQVLTIPYNVFVALGMALPNFSWYWNPSSYKEGFSYEFR